MSSNVFDKNGVEVKEGDVLAFPYVDPMGNLHDDEDFRKEVKFKYGCFGYESNTRFVPLMEWMIKECGEYVPNCGNKIIYTNKYPFWILANRRDAEKGGEHE